MTEHAFSQRLHVTPTEFSWVLAFGYKHSTPNGVCFVLEDELAARGSFKQIFDHHQLSFGAWLSVNDFLAIVTHGVFLGFGFWL